MAATSNTSKPTTVAAPAATKPVLDVAALKGATKAATSKRARSGGVATYSLAATTPDAYNAAIEAYCKLRQPKDCKGNRTRRLRDQESQILSMLINAGGSATTEQLDAHAKPAEARGRSGETLYRWEVDGSSDVYKQTPTEVLKYYQGDMLTAGLIKVG